METLELLNSASRPAWRISTAIQTPSDLPTEASLLRVQNECQPDSEIRAQNHRGRDIPAQE